VQLIFTLQGNSDMLKHITFYLPFDDFGDRLDPLLHRFTFHWTQERFQFEQKIDVVLKVIPVLVYPVPHHIQHPSTATSAFAQPHMINSSEIQGSIAPSDNLNSNTDL